MSTRLWLALAYLIVMGSIVAFSAYGIAVRALPTATVATYAYVNPVIAVLLGSLILNERLTPAMIGGGALIVGAVVLVVRRSPPAQAEPATSATIPMSCTVDERESLHASLIGDAGTYTPPDGGDPNHWVVHASSDDLSLGTYSIPAGGLDDQTRTPRTRSTWCRRAGPRWSRPRGPRR